MTNFNEYNYDLPTITDEFANNLVTTGSNQVGIFDLEALNADQEEPDEGGI